MYQHIIIIGSSYKLGKRIAWHYSDIEIDKQVLIELDRKTKDILGKPNYSIHKLSTDSKEWQSVISKDSFFEDLKVYDRLEDFLLEISADKVVSALDIAKFILAIKPMSNLKLQKMIYLTYADYLLRTGKKLFEDKILAFQYGPVIEEVYEHYKSHGRNEIDIKEGEEGKIVELDGITIPIVIAKILQSDDSAEILHSIKKVFDKFGQKTASQLVTITHREGGPWDRTSVYYGVIEDEFILKYHHNEIA